MVTHRAPVTIDAGVSVNSKTRKGMTALMFAVQSGTPDHMAPKATNIQLRWLKSAFLL